MEYESYYIYGVQRWTKMYSLLDFDFCSCVLNCILTLVYSRVHITVHCVHTEKKNMNNMVQSIQLDD